MFESMSGFLWFFFVSLALIVLGILFEERLIQFEDFLFTVGRAFLRAIRQTWREYKTQRGWN